MAGRVAAQATAEDSARARAAAAAVLDSLGLDSLSQDTGLVDTARRRVPRADSILLSYHPDTTKVRTPLLKADQPRLLTVGPAYHWNRDELFASGALTLADLLDRIPGFAAFSAGWISTPMMGSYLGDPARVRIFYDGVELDPLDPGMRGLQDFASIDLWTLEEVSVERGASELRVYLRSWTVDHTTPYTRADVLTGNNETNLYRAFLEAKNRWLAGVSEAAEGHIETGLLAPDAAAALKQDPFPYGVVANRHVLETIARYSNEQGLTPRILALEEIFPAATLSL